MRDLEYIPSGHKRNKLDLYLPKQAEVSKPAAVGYLDTRWGIVGSKQRRRKLDLK